MVPKVQLNSKSDGVTDNNIVYVTDENGKDINSLPIDKNETKKIVVNSYVQPQAILLR
ncbi:MAG: hypothetical protein ACLTJ5_09180 [Clostridium sp.]